MSDRSAALIRRWWSLVGVLLGLLATGVFLGSSSLTNAAPQQPLVFSHQKHIKAGVQCVFCHPGVLRSAIAGIPSLQKCVGCHQNITLSEETKSEQPEVERLLQQWKSDQPVRWVRINAQPDFVYFSHQPHVTQGLACERCHGNVSQMDGARAVYDINMGFCLDCHRQQTPPEKVERLLECNTCHK